MADRRPDAVQLVRNDQSKLSIAPSFQVSLGTALRAGVPPCGKHIKRHRMVPK